MKKSWGSRPLDAAPGVRNRDRWVTAPQDPSPPDGWRARLIGAVSGRRLLRAAAGLLAAVVFLAVIPRSAPPAHPHPTAPSGPAGEALSDPSGSRVGGQSGPLHIAGDRVSYYVALHELDGLPPDIQPGSEIELWVSWDRQVDKDPNTQMLLDDVFVEGVLAPLVREAPVPVKLSILRKDRADMVLGDRYGTLTAVVVNESPSAYP